MPDAFLRRVIAMREAEQEAAIVELHGRELTGRCHLCSSPMQLPEGGDTVGRIHVCGPCGGTKLARKMEIAAGILPPPPPRTSIPTGRPRGRPRKHPLPAPSPPAPEPSPMPEPTPPTSLSAVRVCEVCNHSAAASYLSLECPVFLCGRCGGLERARRIHAVRERQLAQAQARSARVEQAHHEADNPPPPPEPPPPARRCPCGKKLRASSTGDRCYFCRTNRAGLPTARRGSEVEQRFRSVAKALGHEPNDLLERFMAAWLEKMQGAAPTIEVM